MIPLGQLSGIVGSSQMVVFDQAPLVSSNDGSDVSYKATVERIRTAMRDVNNLRLVVPGGPVVVNAGGETAIGPGFICRGHVEYPIGVVRKDITWGGATYGVVPGGTPLLASDPFPFAITKTSQICYRYYQRMVVPPGTDGSSVSAALAAGGSLATVLHYACLTSVCFGIESAKSAEVTATPSGGNLSITVTWTTPTDEQATTTVRIYADTASATKKLIAEVASSLGTYTITTLAGAGAVAPTVVTVGFRTNYERLTTTGEFFNRIGNGYDGLDYVDTFTKPGSSFTGPANAGAPVVLLVADNAADADPAIHVIGNSLTAGEGSKSAAWNVYFQGLSGWSARALYGRAKESWATMGIGGTALSDFCRGTLSNAAVRIAELPYFKTFYCAYGYNDVQGSTWQQMAADTLTYSQMLPAGSQLRVCCVPPHTYSIDLHMTIGNQNKSDGINGRSSSNANRISFNTWVRAGCQFNGATPVTSGGATPPTIDGVNFFDPCTAIEVDTSNVLTLDGGLHIVPAAKLAGPFTVSSSAGTAFGALSITPVGGGMPAPSNSGPGYQLTILKVLTGTQANALCLIDTNTTTVLTSVALMTNPVSTTPGLLEFANTAALEIAFPAASNTTKYALVGTRPNLHAYHPSAGVWTLVTAGTAVQGMYVGYHNTNLDCGDPLVSALTAGDTFEIWQTSTIDGGHSPPHGAGWYALVAVAFTAHLAALYGA